MEERKYEYEENADGRRVCGDGSQIGGEWYRRCLLV